MRRAGSGSPCAFFSRSFSQFTLSPLSRSLGQAAFRQLKIPRSNFLLPLVVVVGGGWGESAGVKVSRHSLHPLPKSAPGVVEDDQKWAR